MVIGSEGMVDACSPVGGAGCNKLGVWLRNKGSRNAPLDCDWQCWCLRACPSAWSTSHVTSCMAKNIVQKWDLVAV